ncbi:MAG: hypothetical protein L3J95_02095 [Thermoplasmata archaeon]|nr:hypothetical protein [Thermoplasmata archaeon]MCI4359203.1 hypothetical protein [Thermoplasmata archaeon]
MLGALLIGLSTAVILFLLSTSMMGISPGTAHAAAPAAWSPMGPAQSAPSEDLHATSSTHSAPVASDRSNAVTTFNPRCFGITKSTCVRICTPTTPNVVPTGVNHSSAVQPTYTQNIYLCVMSTKTLIYAPTNVPTSGPRSPLALNVTGVQWNGDPYMCTCDGSTYHSDTTTWWTVDTGLSGTNATYPYVYDVTVWNRSNGSSGTQNFYPGETVTWWIYIVNYTNTSGYTHNSSVQFHYRVAGAWAFSPWLGSGQYAGPNASTGDLRLKWSPRTPNWNDTVNVSLAVTPADVTNRTAIGSATLIIEQFAGTQLVANATHRGFVIGSFTNSSGVTIKGNDTANTTISPTFTQQPGDTIVFWVVAQDNALGANDTIVYPSQSFIVNGNGSFSSGVFSDDVSVASSPPQVAQPVINASTLQIVPSVVNPGQNVSVTIQSRSSTTSLFNALVVYSLTYAPLSERSSAVLSLNRVNSTTFRGTIPGMPLNSSVNFTVLAFDYTHHLDVSAAYSYSIPSLSTYVAVLPTNDTFFYIYVYDNGSSKYVSGALVQIRGPTPAFNTVSSTRFGIAYPNGTGNNFLPLLLAANVTYNISVTTQQITTTNGGHELSVHVFGTNPMTIHSTLAKGEDYFVVQEGDSLYFWVNGTVPAIIFSPNAGAAGGGIQLAALLALAGTAVMAFVLYRWFDQIQKRRKAEERRVTL